MAVTNQQIIDYLLANPNLSDAQIAATMQEFSVTPKQLAQAVGADPAQIQARYAEAAPNVYTAENVNKLASQILAQNTTEKWTGGLPPEKAALYMADELAKSGVSDIEQVGQGQNGIVNKMTGEKLVSGYGERTKGNLWSGSYEGKGNTGFGVEFDAQGKPVFFTQGASSSTLGKDILKLAAVAGAVYGLGGFEGLFGGAGAATATGAEAATAFELANAGIAGGAASFTPAQLALIEAGATAAEVAAAGASGGLLSGAIPPTVPPTTPPVIPPTVTPPVVPPTGIPPVVPPTGVPPVVPPTGLPPIVTSAVSSLIPTAVKGLLTPDVISGATSTAGNLLQSQTSKAAAEKAAADINAATQAGVTASQFRPVGMTTRFGTSNYTYDPVTGRMTSAGYKLSPEAKAAQDRLVKLAESGLQQAEGAQQQFAPLQTGARGLFNLGNQYIAQSPQDVAQNYLNQQMALLQPGREVELANLQNRLQQQGRAGLSVAQGGNLGATTPELQALYNARAQQEAQLAANAQQYGQQNVLFGAGLLGQGATAMGNYYGGQQQAYSPYTTALGQVQGLETAAQQPLMLGAQLGQQSATAGANAGRLGVLGTQAAGNILTGNDATYNPYASLLTAAGNPNSMLGQVVSSAVAPGGFVNRSLYPSGNPLQTGIYSDPGYWT